MEAPAEIPTPSPQVPVAVLPKMRTVGKRKTVSIEEALSRGGQPIKANYLQIDGEESSQDSYASPSKKKRAEHDGQSDLPPEFRTAGLLANAFIPSGKIFGPFAGEIIKEEKLPSTNHVFICKVRDTKNKCEMYFYAKEKDKQRCNWLRMIRSPPNEKKYNFLAYNTCKGVCYCAVEDVNVGSELLVLFDADKSSKLNKKGSCKRKSKHSKTFTHSGEKKTASLNIDNDEDGANGFQEDSPLLVPLPQTSDKCEPAGVVAGDGSINCGHCNRKCKTVAQFRVHALKCKSRIRYSCSECDTTTSSKKALDRHKKQCHLSHSVRVKNYRCTRCIAVVGSQREFNVHMKENHPIYKCKTCGIDFDSKADLKLHEDDGHSKDGTSVKCPICKKQFTKGYFKDHYKSHDENAFQCRVCNKNFSSSSNLKKHERKHSPDYKPRKSSSDRMKKCDVCEKLLAGTQALRIHQRIHTGERPHQCDKCSWKFIQGSHLRRHKRTAHGKDRNKNEHKCPICERVYSTAVVLEVHVNTIHKGLRPFKCTNCADTFTMQGHLLRHERTVHGLTDEDDDRRKFVCRQKGCGKKFHLQSQLNKHTFEHTGILPYQCDECKKHFSSTGNLRKHIRRQHLGEKIGSRAPVGDRKFDCPVCDKSYTHPSTLKDHVRIHSDEKITCPKCGQHFVQKSGLRKHLRCFRCPVLRENIVKSGGKVPPDMYSRTKNWVCPKCDKCFAGPSDLTAHDRVHTGEKPFTCDTCGKSFTQAGNLTKHKNYVHAGKPRPTDKDKERTFACSQCDKLFATARDLSMHCRVHTGIKPFECPHCGMAFTQKSNLRKHVKRWHTDVGTRGRLIKLEGVCNIAPVIAKRPTTDTATSSFTPSKVVNPTEGKELPDSSEVSKQPAAADEMSTADDPQLTTSSSANLNSATSGANASPKSQDQASSAVEILSAIRGLVNQYSGQKPQPPTSNMSADNAMNVLRHLITQGTTQISEGVQNKMSSDSERDSAANNFTFPFTQNGVSQEPEDSAESENGLTKTSDAPSSNSASSGEQEESSLSQTGQTHRLIKKLRSHLIDSDPSSQETEQATKVTKEDGFSTHRNALGNKNMVTVIGPREPTRTSPRKEASLLKTRELQAKPSSAIETDASGKTYRQLQTRNYNDKRSESLLHFPQSATKGPDIFQPERANPMSTKPKNTVSDVSVVDSDVQIITHPKIKTKSPAKEKLNQRHIASTETSFGSNFFPADHSISSFIPKFPFVVPSQNQNQATVNFARSNDAAGSYEAQQLLAHSSGKPAFPGASSPYNLNTQPPYFSSPSAAELGHGRLTRQSFSAHSAVNQTRLQGENSVINRDLLQANSMANVLSPLNSFIDGNFSIVGRRFTDE